MSKVDCKVVLLGSADVGKTCLLERYIHGHFLTKTSTTICGSFASKKENVGGKSIILGCWDTAGSERYATMSRMYYRRARAAIVCYSILDRETYERARDWISELLATEEECKIYLCGTKKDLVTNDPNRREVKKESARDLAHDLSGDFFEISSKTGENVASLFLKIAKDCAMENGLCTHQPPDKAEKKTSQIPETWSKQTKGKRVRTIFTPEQLERMEAEFERQQYMVGTERYYLASALNLTEAQVKVWFQNRRIKWRKQHLEQQQAKLKSLNMYKDIDSGGESDSEDTLNHSDDINLQSHAAAISDPFQSPKEERGTQ